MATIDGFQAKVAQPRRSVVSYKPTHDQIEHGFLKVTVSHVLSDCRI
jgi:hypothetical protein